LVTSIVSKPLFWFGLLISRFSLALAGFRFFFVFQLPVEPLTSHIATTGRNRNRHKLTQYTEEKVKMNIALFTCCDGQVLKGISIKISF
jgi:hypothetical protein